MSRRAAAIAILFSLLAGQAGAAEPAKAAKADTQYVDLAPVALPIVVEGQLINYVFVTTRLQLTASADAAKVRAKEPFFRDALVRAAHREPFTNPKDYTAIDAPRLKAVLLREATAIAGQTIKAAVIMSQTPKRRRGLPTPRLQAPTAQVRP